ncbi:MAG: hypothetical protein K0U98_03805 [Deltaproteobacteria bacterium]|nr:hypothetical protein [Deltaproteobacteria bacterium]
MQNQVSRNGTASILHLLLLSLAAALLTWGGAAAQDAEPIGEICGSASPPPVQVSWLEVPEDESSTLLSSPHLTLVLSNNTERLVKVQPELVFDRGRGPSKEALPTVFLAPDHQRSLVLPLTDDGDPVSFEATQAVTAHLRVSTEDGEYLGQSTTESLYFFAEASGGITALGAAAMRQYLELGKLPEARRLGTPEKDEEGVTLESVRYVGPEGLAATARLAIALSLPTTP